MKILVWIYLVGFLVPFKSMAQGPEPLRKERDTLTERGMWREAVNFYEEKLRPISDEGSGSDLARATEALGRLDAWGEFDGLVERSISAQPKNVSRLISAAEIYRRAPHSGRLVAGEFERGRGGDGRGRFEKGDHETSSWGAFF